MNKIKIGDKNVGEGSSTFIIAEAGVNHNGSFEIAKKLIDSAKNAGADAVKFQTFKTEHVISRKAPKANYQKETTGSDSQYQMVKKLELTDDQTVKLLNYAVKKDIIFLSSPFDIHSANLLDKLSVEAFKLGSGEITNLPLIEHLVSKNKPIILSTGMATICEIEEAIDIIESKGVNLILMYCVTSYPAKMADIDLNVIKTLYSAFKLPVGFSDHTMGIELAVASVAMGSCIIEKHFTLDRNMEGPDHKASLEPHEFKNMVNSIRNVENAFKDGKKRITDEEKHIKEIARKSIVSKVFIPQGSKIKRDYLCIKRPGTGIKPKYLKYVIGKEAKADIEADEIIKWDLII